MAVDVKIEDRFLDLSHGKTRVLEAGSGYPTLLVHGAGFLSGADNWLPVMPSLAQKLRVVAMDCLNYGKGDVFEQEFSFGYMVDHIREVIDALGFEKVNLVGHSMGGWLGTLFGYESPHRINKLVLVAAGGTQARPLATMVDWQPPSEDEVRQRVGGALSPGERERVQQIYLEKLRKPDHVEAFAKVMKHMTNPDTRIRYNTMRRLAHIPVPALVIWGSEDKTNDISMGHELADGIPGARLIVYEGVGHAVPHEASERFTADVLSFLEEG